MRLQRPLERDSSSENVSSKGNESDYDNLPLPTKELESNYNTRDILEKHTQNENAMVSLMIEEQHSIDTVKLNFGEILPES